MFRIIKIITKILSSPSSGFVFLNYKIEITKINSRIPRPEKITGEAFSSSMLKLSPKLESYTRALSTSSSMTAFVVSFRGWLQA